MSESLRLLTKKELIERIEELNIRVSFLRQSHATLARGIKKAVQLENWPDFYQLYGSVMFADGVVRLLVEEVNKLRKGRKK